MENTKNDKMMVETVFIDFDADQELRCPNCGELLDNEYELIGDGCINCMRECEKCGNIFDIDDTGWTFCDALGIAVCNDCYDKYYRWYDYVGEYHDTQDNGFTPQKLYGESDNKYIGIEVEFNYHGNNYDYDHNTAIMYAVHHYCNLFSFEKDCTVDIEMVSQPMSIGYWYQYGFTALENIIDTFENFGFVGGYDVGVHLHFSNSWFNSEISLNKLQTIYTFYRDHMLDVLGHKQSRQYCNPSMDMLDFYLEKNNHCVEHTRYTAINTTNHYTVEFRALQNDMIFSDIKNWMLLHIALINICNDGINWDNLKHPLYLWALFPDGVREYSRFNELDDIILYKYMILVNNIGIVQCISKRKALDFKDNLQYAYNSIGENVKIDMIKIPMDILED